MGVRTWIGPDVRRDDAAAVFVSHRHVPDRETGLAVLAGAVARWEEQRGLLHASGYLDSEGEAVLAYAQCADSAAHRPFAGLPGAATVEYRLRRSVVVAPAVRPPGCVVVATFDVDGPERQALIVDSLADALDGTPATRHPGLLAAHFHVSVDGSRVLNYAEWTSEEGHSAFLEGSTRAMTLRVSTSLPGVRPIGFRRYRLQCGTRAQAGAVNVTSWR
ncbi:antibiotic biosynthesis monooxygenase [Saccharothrix obliqua]|uniref:antibiotic biosynthesis monooxygenase n=1 Tax=Saccharothrix obliqua TaxID=2861747 RepID=UPI001C5CFC3F|nr:antibiotic biosynthesis monooxygenase [Saccharothrix obliqua]MBW4722360.1 antibiotic biosynthesis monooxygenase [Saccharothrix obliqua]